MILSNFVNDYIQANKILRKYNQIIQENSSFDKKTKYMYEFTVKFLDCMDNMIDITEVIDANNSLKQEFLNDYNRHIYAISALALTKSNLSLCEEYSSEYLKTERPLKPRQRAFQEALLALISIYNGKLKDAAEHLRRENIYFDGFQNYQNIVNHNITYVEEKEFNSNDLVFYFGGELQKGSYYIDIRMLY